MTYKHLKYHHKNHNDSVLPDKKYGRR